MVQWSYGLASWKIAKPPIAYLPGELLVSVFQYLTHDWSLNIYSSRYPLASIGGVCRQWSKLCEDPAVRRYIPLHSSLDFIEECLELSFSAPIIVVGTILDPDVVQVLSLHLFRVSSMRVEVHGSPTILRPLLEAFRLFPPKNMQAFGVNFRDGFAGCEDLLPIFSATPSEEPNMHVLPATIRHLHLSSSDPSGVDEGIVHKNTIELLRSLSSSLQSLTLGGSYLCVPFPTPSPEEQPYHRFRHPADSQVIFPRLKRLILSNAPWRQIVAAVVGICAPVLNDLQLYQESHKEMPHWNLSGPSEVFNQIKNCYVDRASPSSLEVLVEQDENVQGTVSWKLPDRDFQMYCSFWQQIGVFEEVKSVMGAFNSSERVSLVLPESYNVSEKGWDRLFGHCRAKFISVSLHHSDSVVRFAKECAKRVSDSDPRTFEHLEVVLGPQAMRFEADEERELVVSLAECVPRGEGPLLFTLRGPIGLSREAAAALELAHVRVEQENAGWFGGFWGWK